MFKVIIKKEILQNIYTLKFLILLVLSLVIFPFSMYLGYKNYTENLKEINRAKIAFREDLMRKETWREIADSEYMIVIPSHPLQIFVRGLTSSIGRTASFEFGKDIEIKDSEYDTNPFLAMFGFLDFEFIFKILLSLFAIVFSYDSICGEKEEGVLKLILSNRISRASLLWGKIVGGFITLLIPILISFITGFLFLLIFELNLDIEDIIRIVLILLIGLLYVLIFYILGVLVSAFTHRSSTSLLILLMLWVLIIFVIPNLAKEIGTFIYSVESPSEIAIKKDKLRKEIVDKIRDFYFKWRKLNPGKDVGEITEEAYKKASQEIIKSFNKINNDWNRKKIAQINFITILSRLSPMVCYSMAVTNLSDTGFERYINVITSIEKYRDDYYDFIRKKVTEEEVDRVRAEMGLIKPQKKSINFNEFPVYENYFRKGDLLSAVRKAYIDIFLQSLYLLSLFLMAYFKFLRYDVR